MKWDIRGVGGRSNRLDSGQRSVVQQLSGLMNQRNIPMAQGAGIASPSSQAIASFANLAPTAAPPRPYTLEPIAGGLPTYPGRPPATGGVPPPVGLPPIGGTPPPATGGTTPPRPQFFSPLSPEEAAAVAAWDRQYGRGAGGGGAAPTPTPTAPSAPAASGNIPPRPQFFSPISPEEAAILQAWDAQYGGR